jgi:hypothetical protein
VAVGFALSRLLKASSRDRYQGRSQTSAGTSHNGSPAGTLPRPVTTPPVTTPPRPTTTPPREGLAVPDLPAPPDGVTGPRTGSSVPPAGPGGPGRL